MKTNMRFALCAGLGALWAASSAVGQTAELRSTIAPVAGNSNPGGGTSQVNLDGPYISTSNALFEQDLQYAFHGLNSSGVMDTMTFDYAGKAQSDFGVLKASSSSTLTNAFYNPANDFYDPGTGEGVPTSVGGQVNARYLDYISVTGGPGIESIRLVLRMTGSVSQDSGSYPFSGGYVALRQTYAPLPSANSQVPGSRVDFTANDSFDMTLLSDPFNVVDGEAKVELIMQLVSDWLIYNRGSGTRFLPDGSTVTSTADLLGTLVIEDVLAYDGSGAEVELGSAIGLSGHTYVPGPGSASLLALAGVAAARRRRK